MQDRAPAQKADRGIRCKGIRYIWGYVPVPVGYNVSNVKTLRYTQQEVKKMFFPPIPLIRRKHVVKKLKAANAYTPDTAVTFREAGIRFPDGFCMVTKVLLLRGVIVSCLDGRYYLGRG